MKSCDNIFGKGWVYACVWILFFSAQLAGEKWWLAGWKRVVSMDCNGHSPWPHVYNLTTNALYMYGMTNCFSKWIDMFIFVHFWSQTLHIKIHYHIHVCIHTASILCICSYSDQKYTLCKTIHTLKGIVYTHLYTSVNMKYTVHVTAFSKWSHWMSPKRHCCWMGWLLLQ